MRPRSTACRSRSRAGETRRGRGRERLRQDAARARDPGPRRPTARGSAASVFCAGRELLGAVRRRVARGPGPRDRHGLPGAGGRARSGADDRRADRRGDPAPPRPSRAPRRAAGRVELLREVAFPEPATRRSTSIRTGSPEACGSARCLAIALACGAEGAARRRADGLARRDGRRCRSWSCSTACGASAASRSCSITHDLGVVARHCDRRPRALRRPRRRGGRDGRALPRARAIPYTRGLLRCGAPRSRAAARAAGRAVRGHRRARCADLSARAARGCAFAPRCPERFEPCERERAGAVPGGRGPRALLPVRGRPRGAARDAPPRRPPSRFCAPRGLAKRFALRAGSSAAGGEVLPALRGVSFAIAPRRDARARRRVRQRQDDRGPDRRAPRRAGRGPHPLRRRRTGSRSRARRCGGGGATSRSSSRIPQTSLNPRMRVGRPDRRAAARPGTRRGARALTERVRQLLADVGLGAETADRVSRRSSRAGSGSASRSRARSRRRRAWSSATSRSRRSTSRSRAQIVNLLLDLRERAGLVLPLHLARPRRRVAGRGPHRRHLSRRDRRGGARARRSSRARSIRTRRRCSPPRPESDPSAAPRARRSAGRAALGRRSAVRVRFHPRCPIARPRCRAGGPDPGGLGPGRPCRLLLSGRNAVI